MLSLVRLVPDRCLDIAQTGPSAGLCLVGSIECVGTASGLYSTYPETPKITQIAEKRERERERILQLRPARP